MGVWCGLVWLCVVAACTQPRSVRCDDGRICPAGSTCDIAHAGCASPAQVEVCNGRTQLEPCSYPGVVDGACFDGVCLPAGCGNGTLEGSEVCDDSNRLHGDGCSADCLSDETCGNSIVDSVKGESCDDGNVAGGDACTPGCVTPACGDGHLDTQFNEQCDEGPLNSNAKDAACRPNCQPRRCSDGILDSGESCDDGNLVSNDGCSYDCTSNETCGNGTIDYVKGELCDDANPLHRDGCGGCQPERPTWRAARPGQPGARWREAAAYDAARGRVVVFGGESGSVSLLGDTWEWDGHTWTDVTPPTGSPPPRVGATMVFDVARRRIVMFGGAGPEPLDDTWEWTGSAWLNVTPVTGTPAGRYEPGMAYDAARQRVVLFGGIAAGNVARDDTWEWDGTSWTEMSPASKPQARFSLALTYDPSRGRVVLFGGDRGSGLGYVADTWEWDGTTWSDVTPSSGSPPALARHALAYDLRLGRVVLFGGGGSSAVWTWDGTTWNNATPSPNPISVRFGHALVYDQAHSTLLSLFGRDGNGTATSSTWSWSTVTWQDVSFAPAAPSGRQGHTMISDPARGTVVLFGGFDGVVRNDTWSWNGTEWKNVSPGGGNPGARSQHAMAYDVARDRIVLFGGQLLQDTWEWDGSTWINLTPSANNPAGRSGHAMAYDAARARVVMFGGFTAASSYLADMWEWDGTSWTEVTPASGNPPGRWRHALGYDPIGEQVLLFGGVVPGGPTGAIYLADTWLWNGTAWTNATSANRNPTGRSLTSLAFDMAQGSLVMFGGSNGGALADTWQWRAGSWTSQLPPVDVPAARSEHALAYDAARGQTVLFGGASGTRLGDTWTYRYQQDAPAIEGCLYGLDSDGDGETGCDDADCFGACTPACNAQLMTCDPAWPHCGDGSCAAVETQRQCPVDCGTPGVACGDFVCEAPETITSCPADCSPP